MQTTRFIAPNGYQYELAKLTERDSAIIPQLKAIIEASPVQKWMDDVKDLTDSDYIEWLSEENSDLLGVFLGKILVGFIYYYPTKTNNELEISYARLATAERGFMADTIKQSLLYIKAKRPDNTSIVADIDPRNTPSVSAITQAGFKKSGEQFVYTYDK